MVYQFKLDSTTYYFNEKSLQLFKDSIPGEVSLHKKEVIRDDKTLRKTIFIVANKCNGDCVYCYEKDGNFDHPFALMDKDSADRALSYLSTKKYTKITTVSFFGGEPTLNIEIIRYLLQKIDETYEVGTYEITTNAALIDDEMVELFVKYDFRVIISLDGPKDIHDKLRINCSYDKIMNLITIFKKTRIKDNLELNCTYTKFHAEYINYKDLLCFFEKLGIKYNISNVMTEIDWLSLPSEEEDFKRSIDLAYENLYEYPLYKATNRFVKAVIDALARREYQECFCDDLMSGNLVVFDYNGKCYPCVGLLNQCKMGAPEIEMSNEKSNPVCNDCWAKGLCRNCITDVVLQKAPPPYLGESCPQKQKYEYALLRLVQYYHESPTKFQAIIDNFYM